MKRLCIFFSILFLFTTYLALCQDVLDVKISHDYAGKPLVVLLTELEQKHPVKFYFRSEWIENIKVPSTYQERPLSELLGEIFKNSDLGYVVMQPGSIVIVKDPTQAKKLLTALQDATLNRKKIEVITMGLPNQAVTTVMLSGLVTDSKTQLPVPRVAIRVNMEKGTITDEEGKYNLILKTGRQVINFSSLGFEDKVVDFEAYVDADLNIALDEQATQLEEVVIESQALRESTNSRVGETKLTVRDIKTAPALMGEVDLVKQVQNLPGVTTVGEAASGFNVRGGSVDQNLILYDGLPVFNSSHAFGFLTAFNPEAVNDVTFYKGGIPAEYGGRTSSVLDIRSRDGDFTKWNGQAGIGLITSNLMVNGPLQKDKTSIALSLRSTYSNWLVRSLRTSYANLKESKVFFYDGTLKVAHKLSDKTKLSFTGYSSWDAFRLTGDTTYRWSNLQLSSMLNHEFSSRLNAEFTIGLSSFGYSVLNESKLTASDLSYQIKTILSKGVLNYQLGNDNVNFGGEMLLYKINPGALEPLTANSNAAQISTDTQHSLETSVFGSYEKTLADRFFIEAGLRMPLFMSFGSASINLYQQEAPRDVTTIRDTMHVGKFKPIKTYVGLEPRFSIRWMTTPASSIKFGYNRMYQFLHLVTNTAAVTPVDIWQPSGYYFKPQRSDQLSLGYFKDLKNKMYGTSVESFYKWISNILDFKDGAQLILNKHLETDLLQGKGKAYGVETSISKNSGKLTGSINYTYSRSLRKFSGSSTTESINRGKQYPSNFDQPHILNISWKVNMSRRYFLTGNFTYRTGRPVTVPLSVFEFENSTVAYFSGRNQYRIPDYHRLDLALVIEGNHKRKKMGDGTWIFSVYNVYGRQNPYTIFFKGSYNGVPKPYQLSIVGSIFPSVSFNFKF